MTNQLSSSLPPIGISAVRVAREAERAVLSADVQADGLSMPPSIWFEVAARFGDGLAVNGDPFLPAIVMRAMREGREVVVEDSVSALLAETLPRIMNIHAGWSREEPEPLREVRLTISPSPRVERAQAAAAFFSGGADSLYTVLTNQARYPRSDSRALSHLVLVHGLDVPLDNAALFGQVEGSAKVVANALGLQLVTVRTNVREVVRGIAWGSHAHGAALAGIALALSRLFHTVFIASSFSFLEMHPWGSHPALDPLWSTESLEIVHDGAETSRVDKLGYLARSSLALAHLRVCWRNPEGAYNCGRCEKCLRTMIALDLAGVLDRADRFPPRIAPADIGALAIPPSQTQFWYPLLERLRPAEHHRELVAAIEHALDRGRGAVRLRGAHEGAIWRCLKHVGVTPARIKIADQRLLGGALSALKRSLLHGGKVRVYSA